MSIEKQINVTVEGDKLTILQGNAPEPEQIQPVHISGDIKAPYAYYQANTDFLDPGCQMHVEVDSENMTVTLLIDPHYKRDTVTVTGKLMRHHILQKVFKVNTGEAISKSTFIQKLKMYRHYFPDKEKHGGLLERLEKLEMNIEKTIKQEEKKKNTFTFEVKQLTKSELPDTINIKAPVFVGYDDMELPLELDFEVDGAAVSFYLHSPDMAEYIERESIKLLKESIEGFEGVENIAVIHT